jgi:Ni/Fe-hydrogenase subunit HybB-like protein
MIVNIHFCICQAQTKVLRRQLYQAPVSRLLLASAIVSGFGGCLWDGSPSFTKRKLLFIVVTVKAMTILTYYRDIGIIYFCRSDLPEKLVFS